MIMIIIYLPLYFYIIYFDLLPIKKNNHKNLFLFNLITICISFLIIVLVGLDFKVPSPANLIENIVNILIH